MPVSASVRGPVGPNNNALWNESIMVEKAERRKSPVFRDEFSMHGFGKGKEGGFSRVRDCFSQCLREGPISTPQARRAPAAGSLSGPG